MPKPKSEDWFNQIRKNIRDTFQNITAEILEVFEERPSYVQMRLPVEKITQEFEDSLKEKIEHSIVHAEIREATKGDIEHIFKIYGKAWQSTSMPFRQVNQETFLKFHKHFKTVLKNKAKTNSHYQGHGNGYAHSQKQAGYHGRRR